MLAKRLIVCGDLYSRSIFAAVVVIVVATCFLLLEVGVGRTRFL